MPPVARLVRWFGRRNWNLLKSCLGGLNRVFVFSGSGGGLTPPMRKMKNRGVADSKRLQRLTAMCTGHGCVRK